MTEPADAWWIGFDCGGGFDLAPNEAQWYSHDPQVAYRDITYVRAVCELLAEQIRAAALR
jgi:hypothetical protein